MKIGNSYITAVTLKKIGLDRPGFEPRSSRLQNRRIRHEMLSDTAYAKPLYTPTALSRYILDYYIAKYVKCQFMHTCTRLEWTILRLTTRYQCYYTLGFRPVSRELGYSQKTTYAIFVECVQFRPGSYHDQGLKLSDQGSSSRSCQTDACMTAFCWFFPLFIRS